jgi:tetratricopeptide (TPR) repeat protein
MSRFHHLEFGEPELTPRATPEEAGQNETSCLSQARTSFAAGHFAKALRAYAKTLEYNPKNDEAWAGQVRMLLELHEDTEAINWANRALEHCPDSAEVLAAKAVASVRAGDTAAALTFSDAAIATNNQLPYVWLARADVLLSRKQKGSEPCFERALGCNPTQWLTRWLISRILCLHRCFALALQHIQHALETGADQAVVWHQLAVCRQHLGMPADAITAFQHAQQLDPGLVTSQDLASLQHTSWPKRLAGWWRRRQS